MKTTLHVWATAVLSILFVAARAQSTTIMGPLGTERFGQYVAQLSTGNYFVIDPFYDDGEIVDVGAVFLYNGSTHALISVLKGSSPDDRVGHGGYQLLDNGNFLVKSHRWNNGATTQAGAVTWVNGTTGLNGVVSSSNSLVGSTAFDGVGGSNIYVLTNGNYVVVTPEWDNGAMENAGAATWGSKSAGVVGVISSNNSLVGTSAWDGIGNYGISILSNGNYVVPVFEWDNGDEVDAGAFTFGNGTTGVKGEISSLNSLIGTHSYDFESAANFQLTNGNYVIVAPFWDNGDAANVGAVVWCDGETGFVGSIKSSNALIGEFENSRVGRGGLLALSNGNYVVLSRDCKFERLEYDEELDDHVFIYPKLGAVTWANGSTGITGFVNEDNSLVGNSEGDMYPHNMFQPSMQALSNGNYVVWNPLWDKGDATDVGAVTWGNGSTGISGQINSSNSLIGSTANDRIGSHGVTALTNGNYVVKSPLWDKGDATDVGAVTWGNGSTGSSGEINNSNSLIGSTENDQLSWDGVLALTNGNYVVKSSNWDNGDVIDAGAVTWGNGNAGISGIVSNSNSLIGSTTSDLIGRNGVFQLSNGNYVVSSPVWDNGDVIDAGAVTWGNGSTGISGTINSSNSLIGSSTNDNVGNRGVRELSNGNYVVISSEWDNGDIEDAGAVTWGNGSTGISGIISSSNSLIGSSAYDLIGNGSFLRLANGNYVVISSYWTNGSESYAGAVTWGNGATGISGVVSLANSLVGSTYEDFDNYYYETYSDGSFSILVHSWDNGIIEDAGALFVGNGTSGIAGTINSCNSVLGTVSDEGFYFKENYNVSTGRMMVGSGRKGNKVIVFNPAEAALANTLDATAVIMNGSNRVPIMAGSSCRIIATLKPTGASPVNGSVDAKAWIEAEVPTHAGRPYVARHYEITPANSASTATGQVTLYFTQQEFNDYNAHEASDLKLPANGNDGLGIANLKVIKYSGISSDGSGLPVTYSGEKSMIDPDDSDIVWNAELSRWEVSFHVAGFSGFMVEATAETLPVRLLEFNGRLQQSDALLNWKTDNEQNTAHFEVERSTDGRSFAKIGQVLSANTAGKHSYNFTDAQVANLSTSAVFYRLKQLDQDGKYTYSRIVRIGLNTGKTELLLYPNPVRDQLNLSIHVDQTVRAKWNLLDHGGRVTRTGSLVLLQGSNSTAIDVSGLPSGMYILDLRGEGLYRQLKVVKE
jgi:hypothetical protein